MLHEKCWHTDLTAARPCPAVGDDTAYKTQIDSLAEQIQRIESIRQKLRDERGGFFESAETTAAIDKAVNSGARAWSAAAGKFDQIVLGKNLESLRGTEGEAFLGDTNNAATSNPNKDSQATPQVATGSSSASRADDISAKYWREAEDIKLRSIDRVSEAELRQLDLWKKGEAQKIKTREDAAALDVLYAVKRAAIEIDSATLTEQKAKDEADKEKSRLADIQAYKDAAAVSSLAAAGRFADAELLKIQTDAQRRIDAIEDAETRQAAIVAFNAQQRANARKEEADDADQQNRRLAGIAGRIGELSGRDRTAAYNALGKLSQGTQISQSNVSQTSIGQALGDPAVRVPRASDAVASFRPAGSPTPRNDNPSSRQGSNESSPASKELSPQIMLLQKAMDKSNAIMTEVSRLVKNMERQVVGRGVLTVQEASI
jgi:hypothetical protein